jgi:hypothetical protein
MNRASFVAGTAAFASLAAASSLPAFASTLTGTTTQGDLFASLPHGRPGQWTRVILGSGATYQKQIGLGTEIDRTGRSRLYVETQVGMPGGSCNPSSMRKAYLREAAFGSILHGYSLLANVGRTENMVYRYGDDVPGGTSAASDSILHLLDEPWLYDSRPLRIKSAKPERIHIASAMHDTTHVVAEFSKPRTAKERLERVELWHSPDFPFGVARYRATLRGLEPFELHVYSHGVRFTSLLAMSLDEVREITRNGEYGQLPASI